jgi:hypothetical protein
LILQPPFFLFSILLGAIHRRDSIEVISIKSQLDLQPDGEIPHVTNWPLNLLFNSNRDDPSNIYCSPNKKLTVSDMLLYYKNNFTELIRTERLYLRGGKKDVSTPFVSSVNDVKTSENEVRKSKTFEEISESDSVAVIGSNNNNNNNNVDLYNYNGYNNAYNKNKNNKVKSNNKSKNKKHKNTVYVMNNNNNNNNNNKYMHRNNKFENTYADDASEFIETRRVRKIRKMQDIARYMKDLHAEKIEY